jgi:hypothetical protein
VPNLSVPYNDLVGDRRRPPISSPKFVLSGTAFQTIPSSNRRSQHRLRPSTPRPADLLGARRSVTACLSARLISASTDAVSMVSEASQPVWFQSDPGSSTVPAPGGPSTVDAPLSVPRSIHAAGRAEFLPVGFGLTESRRSPSLRKAAKGFLVLASLVGPLLHAAPGHADDIFSDIGKSVKKGVHEAGRAIENGAHQTGNAIKRGAHKVGQVFHPSSPHKGNRASE